MIPVLAEHRRVLQKQTQCTVIQTWLFLVQVVWILSLCRSMTSRFSGLPCLSIPRLNSTTDQAPSNGGTSNHSASVVDPRAHDDVFRQLIGPSDKRLPILEGRYNLVWMSIPKNISRGNSSYEGVTCSFCPVDWTQQKQAPNTVPRYHNVYSGELCDNSEHAEITFDLKDLVKMARRYDALPSTKVNNMRQAGFIFHESRSGSTLAANMLTVAYPSMHRVYSEPGVLYQAMRTQNKELVKDVLYMLGRTSNLEETRVFYKLRSVAVRHMDAMPDDMPWIFMYRNPEDVVASHFNPTETGNTVCLQERKNPHQLLVEIAKTFGKEIDEVSDETFCATRLASLCLAAIRHYERTGKGHFVNYDSLPESMWETIAPEYFGVSLSKEAINNMKNISGVYAKGGQERNQREWDDEQVDEKSEQLTKKQRKAAREVLQPYFEQMEQFAAKEK